MSAASDGVGSSEGPQRAAVPGRAAAPERAGGRRDDGAAGRLPAGSPGTAIPNTFPSLFAR
jgi:hypothetical protein